MDTMFRCPTCKNVHDEPLEAILGLEATCFTCAVEAASRSAGDIFADAPPIEFAVAA